MSNVRISDLTPGVALNGTELFEIVQSGNSLSTNAAAIVTLGNTYTANHNAANFGINNLNFIESNAANPPAVGVVRLGNTENIVWRNAANNANVLFGLDATDSLLIRKANDTVNLDFEADHAAPVAQRIGELNFYDDSDLGTRRLYGQIGLDISSSTDGAEIGGFSLSLISAGTLTQFFAINEFAFPNQVRFFEDVNIFENALRFGSNAAGNPPATETYITKIIGELNINVPTGASIDISINAVNEYVFNATQADFNTNSIVNLGGLELNNPADTQQYVFVTSAIAADRNVTLPLLLGNDIFVFEAFAQTLTNKTIVAANNTITIASTDLTDTANIVLETIANTYTAGQKQTFAHSASTAGLNITPVAGNPSTPANGDIWINDSTNQIFARINGADVDLGAAGGGGEVFTWTANHDANGFALEDPLFADPIDTTKRLDIDLAGNATTAVLTLDINQLSNQTLTVPAITGADNLVTDNVAATLLSKTLGTGTIFSVSPTINDGITFTFNPNNTEAGINVGANGTDPSSPDDGDIYYQTGTGFRVRDAGAWVTLGQPDTPWTVDHDFDRYSVLNAGAIVWPILDPRTVPAGTTPNIYFEEDPSIDHLRINVPTSAEFRIYVNDSERYSFSNNQFDPQQNAINNSGNITINTASATGIITVGRSNEVVSQNAGEIRFRGGNDDYGQIEVEMTNTTNPTERGTMRFQVSANDILVDMITLTGSTSGSNSTISFNNRPMGSQINMNGFQIANALFISSNDANEADDGFLRMGADEYITWRNNGDTNNNGITFNTADQIEFSIGNITQADYTFSSTVFDMIGRRIEQLLHIQDASQNEQLIFASVASAVNELTITNAATGNPALITATGEANAALTIATSGTGIITLANDVEASGDVVVGDRLQGNKGPDVASATTITLGDGNFFDITGTTTIDAMTSTNWQEGSIVVLHFDAAATVRHNIGADGFFLAGSIDWNSIAADDTLVVIWNGSRWEELSRSVN